MTNEPVLKIEKVSKVFKVYNNAKDRLLQSLFKKKAFHQEYWALQDISLEVFAGEVVGIIGRNGSGKSTLLQIIAGTLKATTGEVMRRGRIAALLELGSGFNPEYTGRENIFFNAMLLGLTEEEIRSKLDDIIDFADIGEFIDQPVKTYSSGMFVRLAFAVSTYVDAEILIIDEALAVGDAAFQFKCMNRLEELLEKNVTILLVSHDVQMIKSYCSRAVYLHKGKLIHLGDCETTTEMYLRDTVEAQRAELADGQMQSSIALHEEGTAYGNGKGHILSVELSAEDDSRSYFNTGERIYVDIAAKLHEKVPAPRITLTIRDQRGYNLYGVNNLLLKKNLTVDEDGIIRTRISFNGDLQAGEYAITIRLDNCPSEVLCELLDKQINVAHFKILNPHKQFDAVVNLHGTFENC